MTLPKEFRCPQCGAFITATFDGAVKGHHKPVATPRTVPARLLDPKADPSELVQAWFIGDAGPYRTREEAEKAMAGK